MGGAARAGGRNDAHRNGPPALSWQRVANATLAVVIVLAGFGAWRVYDRFDGNGAGDPPATVPGVAMAPGTPEATEPVEGKGEPIVTPTPAYACDFTRDIPIFEQADESPIEGTALLLTTGGDLVLACPEEPNPVVLATGLEQAWPAGWPGVVAGSSGWPADGDYRPLLINVTTGTVVETGFSERMQTTGFNELDQTPWTVRPATGDSGQWAIIDLRTMESRTLNDFADPDTLGGGTIVPPGTPLLMATAGDMIAIGIMTTNDIDGEGALFTVGGLPGTLLVLNGSFDDAHWIDIPDDLPATRRMTLSPDGSHLALKSNDGDASFNGTVTYTIVRTSDGAEVARSEGVHDDFSTVRWVQDGRAIAYTNGHSLMTLAAEPGAEPATLLETGDTFGIVRGTYDPDVVTVSRVQAEEVATETPDAVHWMMYAVNTVTGEAIEIDGVDVRDSYGWELPPSRYLVLAGDWVDSTEPVTYRVVDAVTGEEIDELSDIEMAALGPVAGFGKSSVAFTNDGAVEVIAFSAAQIVLLRESGGEPEIRQLPALPGLDGASAVVADLTLSPDGAFLSAMISNDGEGDRFLLDLTDPDAAWSVYPTQAGSDSGRISFVPGAGD